MKILIVEDNNIVLEIFKHCFSKDELENIDFASSITEAVDKMESNMYSKIVANYKPSDDVDIFAEAKKQDIDERIMITASSRCDVNSTEATCGVRKPLTLKNMRQICFEEKGPIENLLGFMSHQA